MKIKNITILVMLFIVWPCFAKTNPIPEVSTTLYYEDLMNLTGKPVAKAIFKNNEDIIIVTRDGEILGWNVPNRVNNFNSPLNRSVTSDVFSQNNFLVLKETPKDPDTILFTPIIFDLNTMKEVPMTVNRKITHTVGINSTLLIYVFTNPAPQLSVLNYHTGEIIKTLALKEKETVFNSQWKGNQLLILSSENLYIYNQSNNNFETIELKDKASSGFLLDGPELNYICYGSTKRELIRYSLTKKTADFKCSLPDVLLTPPQKVGPYIFIIPKDNNFYFFNKNGTVYWWNKLNSSIQLTPQPMKDNIALCLTNKSVKFLNYKTKQIITYPLNHPITTNPVNIGEYVYFVYTDDYKEADESSPRNSELIQMGNYYGAEIRSSAGNIQTAGKTARVNITPVNLINPTYKVTLTFIPPTPMPPRVVFNKELGLKDSPEFVWMPNEPGEYQLVIIAKSKNKSDITIGKSFRVYDIEDMAHKFFYKLQSECESGRL